MKKVAKGNRGVTLVALIITIVVLLILASVATISGIGVINSSKLTTFTAEMKIMQTQVNNMYQKSKSNEVIQIGDTKYTGEQILTIGEDISAVSEQANLVFTAEASGITDKTGYRYFSQGIINALQIEGVEGAFFVNVEKRSIISYMGLIYEDQMYYTLNQLPKGLYNVEYENKNTGKPTFDVSYDSIGTDKWKITVSNIQYDGYINKWQVKYQLKGNDFWSTSEDLSFGIKEEGIYKIKIVNDVIESEEKELIIVDEYRKEGLFLHYDAINNTGEGDEKHNATATVWKDLSGNNHDGTLKQFDSTENSRWEEKSLKFDGINDSVDTGIKASTAFTLKDDFTLEIVFNMNKVTAVGNQYETRDTGIIFGAIYYCGYGIFWTASNNITQSYVLCCGTRNNENRLSISENIANVTQKNRVTQVYNKTNNEMSMYINGKFLKKSTIQSDNDYNMPDQMGNICINKNSTYSGNPRPVYSDMNVYSARIYSRALTETEIQLNQQMDKNRFEL